MKSCLLSFAVILLVQGCHQSTDQFTISTNFPGGNIQVDSIKESSVYLQPDNAFTDTTDGHWFYWNLKVLNANSRKLSFHFNHSDPLTIFGPAVSRGNNASWDFLWAESGRYHNAFDYEFDSTDDTVWFALSIPYTEKDFRSFCEKNSLNHSILCQSNRGRKVEFIELGNDDATYSLVFTARHHACEMPANYVLEGIISQWLKNDWLKENTQLFAIPFMDKDGVELGEQGKNRIPHDHNRDYVEELYNEVKSVKAEFPTWTKDRPTIFIDIHAPWIRVGRNETIFIVENEDSLKTLNIQSLMAIIEKENQSGLPFSMEDVIRHGEEWNNFTLEKSRKTGLMSSSTWVRQQPNTIIANTLEVSYASVHEKVISPGSLNEFGEAVSRSIEKYFQGESSQ